MIQCITAGALAAIKAAFDRESGTANWSGLLLDYDHASYDPDGSTAAAGWILGMEIRGEELWIQVRWTNSGKQKIDGGEFKYLSPAWRCEDVTALDGIHVMPGRIDSVAVTNCPNIKGMVPLTNKRKPMKEINELLNLAADAPPEETRAVLGTVLANRAELETGAKSLGDEIATLTAALKKANEEMVDQTLTKFANRFAPDKRDKWRTALLANHRGTVELLESIRDSESNIRRSQTATPDGNAAGDKTSQQTAAVREYRNRTGCSFDEAWHGVRRERPELFA
jgi:phage I-like protein